MNLDAPFWAGKRVCVTGGSGFLGWHLLRQLLPLSCRVRILGLPPISRQLRTRLQGLDWVIGDVRDPAVVGPALRDCDLVFHAAGPVAMGGPALERMYEIHVLGTQLVLRALPAHARLVHTSSVVTVGACLGQEALTEDRAFQPERLNVAYIHAKRAAEDCVLQAAANGVDAVVVNPAFLTGPEDHEGSVMGNFCLRYWRGKMPLMPRGGVNFVDVRDVAHGHLLAAKWGRAGRRYILGGENRPFTEFIDLLDAVRGQPARRRRSIPIWLQTALACFAEVQAYLRGREPYPSLQHVRMNRYSYYYSSQRAAMELGYQARPLRESLTDTYRWFLLDGWLKDRPEKLLPAAPTSQRRAA
jgi:dihydroflavonol-4-reductase